VCVRRLFVWLHIRFAAVFFFLFWWGDYVLVPGSALFVFLVYHSERAVFVAFGSLCLLLQDLRLRSLFIIKLHKPSSLVIVVDLLHGKFDSM
jgi:hypothetical protein